MVSLERRDFLKLTGIFGCLYLSDPKTLFAEMAAVQTSQAPFLWTREEILFGPAAGFEEARARIPLGVYSESGIQPAVVAAGIVPWNNLARELRRSDLFYIEKDATMAKIVVTPSIRNRVTAFPDYVSPYTRCVVELHENIQLQSPQTVTHELGHTLGFVDFVFAITDISRLVNPQRCDLPDKPIRSAMASNSIGIIGEHDAIMLQLAGYA